MGFQQGLSGLSASAKNLDVIGHNIANSGTTGFKASRTEFSEIVASALGTSSSNNAGIGVAVGAIAQQFTQGNLTVTGNNLDVAVNGSGFFMLSQPDGSAAYTRDGSFKLDNQGNLVTNSGSYVQGYALDATTGTSGLVNVKFPTTQKIDPKETKNITASFNLDARASLAAGDPTATPPVPATPRSTYGTSINVYDSQGVATPVNLYFEKSGANTWNVYTQLDDPAATPPFVAPSIGQLTFDANGKLVGGNPIAGLSIPVNNPNSPAPQYVTADIDLAGTTQFGSSFNTVTLRQDGYASGELVDITIDGSGKITSSYSNGVTRAEYQLALANFANTQGLASLGNNQWAATLASGVPVPGTPGNGSLGVLRSGTLEDSNVDLTAELVNMMTAQRAYQANAQTIKTQDQVMSTLVNLR